MNHKRKRPWRFLLLIFLLLVAFGTLFGKVRFGKEQTETIPMPFVSGDLLDDAISLFTGEPTEVRELKAQEVTGKEEGFYEYYFEQLNDDQKRGYRQMLTAIRNREESFYVTVTGDDVTHVYSAVLKDHPELFWIHNREHVYMTSYSNQDYSRFSPGYTYTEAEMNEILGSMESAYQSVRAMIPEEADTYRKVETVYTWLIDYCEYVVTEHDQSIAGVFWAKEAVCAGYAGAVKYLLDRLGIPCIYVEGDSSESSDGHAWNIVWIDGEPYIVDATNGDQPDFLQGNAAMLAEHKTTIMDYLCPFPEEYAAIYTPADEYQVPACTAHADNFYVRNNACFDDYDWQKVYDLCRLRIDNNAAVVRFRFARQEDFERAVSEWGEGDSASEVANYYMTRNGLDRVEYHFGVLDTFKTIYEIF